MSQGFPRPHPWRSRRASLELLPALRFSATPGAAGETTLGGRTPCSAASLPVNGVWAIPSSSEPWRCPVWLHGPGRMLVMEIQPRELGWCPAPKPRALLASPARADPAAVTGQGKWDTAQRLGHRRPSSSADPHSPALCGEDVSPLEKGLTHPSGAHLPQRAKQLPGPGDSGRPGLCGLPHRPEMASERHQLPPEYTSGKSWKGFTAQQFLHCPSHPCTHRSRLEGLGPGCSRDPLGQPPSHQHGN